MRPWGPAPWRPKVSRFPRRRARIPRGRSNQAPAAPSATTYDKFWRLSTCPSSTRSCQHRMTGRLRPQNGRKRCPLPLHPRHRFPSEQRRFGAFLPSSYYISLAFPGCLAPFRAGVEKFFPRHDIFRRRVGAQRYVVILLFIQVGGDPLAGTRHLFRENCLRPHSSQHTQHTNNITCY